MTDRSLFLFSVREIPLPHIFRGSADRFFSAAEFPDCSVKFSKEPRDRTFKVFSGAPGTTENAGAPLEYPRSTPPESDPTKADPHDLDEEKGYLPDTPGGEQSEQRR